jgi:hypothetical protein
VIKKGDNKILKNKDFTKEIRFMWNGTTKVITLTLRKTGNNSENA